MIDSVILAGIAGLTIIILWMVILSMTLSRKANRMRESMRRFESEWLHKSAGWRR